MFSIVPKWAPLRCNFNLGKKEKKTCGSVRRTVVGWLGGTCWTLKLGGPLQSHQIQKKKARAKNMLILIFDIEGGSERVQATEVDQTFFLIHGRSRTRVLRMSTDIALPWNLHPDNGPCHTALSISEFLTQKIYTHFPCHPGEERWESHTERVSAHYSCGLEKSKHFWVAAHINMRTIQMDNSSVARGRDWLFFLLLKEEIYTYRKWHEKILMHLNGSTWGRGWPEV